MECHVLSIPAPDWPLRVPTPSAGAAGAATARAAPWVAEGVRTGEVEGMAAPAIATTLIAGRRIDSPSS